MMAQAIDPTSLQQLMAAHLELYRYRVPQYQAEMLSSLAELWLERPSALLDIGGGTGIIAEAIRRFLPVDKVTSIDLVDRFCKSLTVETRTYDGRNIPFPDNSFDAGTLNNVVHHVPKAERPQLFREIRRVVNGPLFIKDHLSQGWLDDRRLSLLDAIGNIPFGGMVSAEYLRDRAWQDLASTAGWRIAATAHQRQYRRGAMAAAFPNRLEVTYRLEPL